jgi:hypothetical protein
VLRILSPRTGEQEKLQELAEIRELIGTEASAGFQTTMSLRGAGLSSGVSKKVSWNIQAPRWSKSRFFTIFPSTIMKKMCDIF